MSPRNLLLLASASALSAIAVGCSCSDPRVPNSISAEQLRSQPRLAEGQHAFMQSCNQCHPGGSGGLGPPLNDKRFPPFVLRMKVRHSIGTMPKFSEEALPDAQLDDITVYLRYLRQNQDDLER